jgi:hypothetical protein
MNSRTTRRFRELFAALPAKVQQQAREAYRLFQQNPAHPVAPQATVERGL